jgi:hypothetical protein
VAEVLLPGHGAAVVADVVAAVVVGDDVAAVDADDVDLHLFCSCIPFDGDPRHSTFRWTAAMKKFLFLLESVVRWNCMGEGFHLWGGGDLSELEKTIHNYNVL